MYQWMPSPSMHPSTATSSTELASWYSCVGFLSVITIYHLWRHQNNYLRVPHENLISDAKSNTNNNLGVSNIPSKALFNKYSSAQSVSSFPWEPKRVPTQKVDVSVLPSATKCQTVDAQQQLHFLSSMTFANGLRPPSCPCCQ